MYDDIRLQKALITRYSVEFLGEDAPNENKAFAEEAFNHTVSSEVAECLLSWPKNSSAKSFWLSQVAAIGAEDVSAKNAVILAQITYQLWNKNLSFEDDAVELLSFVRPLLAEQFYIAFRRGDHQLELVFELLDDLGVFLAKWYAGMGGSAQKVLKEVRDIFSPLGRRQVDENEVLTEVSNAWRAYIS